MTDDLTLLQLQAEAASALTKIRLAQGDEAAQAALDSAAFCGKAAAREAHARRLIAIAAREGLDAPTESLDDA